VIAFGTIFITQFLEMHKAAPCLYLCSWRSPAQER
jgi:hypothetical protein